MHMLQSLSRGAEQCASALHRINLASMPAELVVYTPWWVQTDPTSAPSYPAGAEPSGSIVVKDEGGAVVGQSTATDGTASTTATLANGLHKLTTSYSGDSVYAASTSTVPYLVLVQSDNLSGGVTIGK